MSNKALLHWPRRQPPPERKAPSDWLRKVSTEDLALLQAISYLSRDRPDLVPQWAEPLVARIKAAADEAPEPPPEKDRGPMVNPIWSQDFETALAHAWPVAGPHEREALRTLAEAFGAEVPPEPPPEPPAEPDPTAQDAPSDPPEGCSAPGDPEEPPSEAHTGASEHERHPVDVEPPEPEPRTYWQRFWSTETDRSDDAEGKSPVGWANDFG